MRRPRSHILQGWSEKATAQRADGLAGIDFCGRLHVRVQLLMTGWITTLDKKEFSAAVAMCARVARSAPTTR